MADRLSTLAMDVDLVESRLALGFGKPRGWIGLDLLPQFTDASNGLHTIKAPIFGTEYYNLVDTEHALKSRPNQVELTWTYQTFALKRYALEAVADPDEIRTANAVGIRLPEKHRRLVWYLVELAREKATADLLQNTASYAVGFSEITAAGSGWNEKTGALSNVDPIEVLRSKMRAVDDANLSEPNIIGFGRDAWDALINNTNVIERMRGGRGSDTTNIPTATAADVADWLAIDEKAENKPRIVVGGAKYRNDETSTFVKMWDDNVMILIASDFPTEDPEPYFGVTLSEALAYDGDTPITGFAGDYETGPWQIINWYLTWYGLQIAKNDAGYLIKDVVK